MAAVVLALEALPPRSEEASRLFKLLTFMDRLLFATTPHSDEGETVSLDSIVSHRLQLFWRGAWQELWADAEAGAKAARARATSDDEGFSRWIEALVAGTGKSEPRGGWTRVAR